MMRLIWPRPTISRLGLQLIFAFLRAIISRISALEAILKTLFLLMAQYDGKVIIPAEIVCRDYFPHLTLVKFLRKVNSGEIALPITRAERSQKSAKGVHHQDLASYLDKRREIALSEARAFQHR